MDIFLEKIVKKKKTIADYTIIAGVILLAVLLMLIILSFRFLSSFAPLFVVGIGYIAYMLIRNRNIEYEYIVTNGDLDIDIIIAQRKRKRIFSGSCKDFEMIAKLTSGKYDYNNQNTKDRVVAVSSMDSSDVYFISFIKDGKKSLVFFEPHAKMVESFKKYIPLKVFE
ncbi:DUF6106 family protein [Ruminiclostridium sufflavum]|uniref:DUF6106 family protein n=1 Tax=Ruminiclostridium sufflavum TaxID=396504 RepID=UPI000D7C019A|nr:DUF6106 family protein [Ruminiclostridium sufflavum]